MFLCYLRSHGISGKRGRPCLGVCPRFSCYLNTHVLVFRYLQMHTHPHTPTHTHPQNKISADYFIAITIIIKPSCIPLMTIKNSCQPVFYIPLNIHLLLLIINSWTRTHCLARSQAQHKRDQAYKSSPIHGKQAYPEGVNAPLSRSWSLTRTQLMQYAFKN